MNALANKEVGDFMNRHFICTYQRVGTFEIVNNAKQGGNVASYFCDGEERVLHALAGPVDAKTFLREARWAVETDKHAALLAQDSALGRKSVLRRAHLDRLASEVGVDVRRLYLPSADAIALAMRNAHLRIPPGGNALNLRARTHYLLACYPHVELRRIYNAVFDDILNEKISLLPVAQR